MADKLTPMMRQYRRIKSELDEDVLLLFRLGDFYEMFFDDAHAAAPVLGVALTRRNGVPMCGIPYHALDNYLAKLIRAGRKAALCEQVEDPALARGIVRREVTRIVTPGTVTEDGLLDEFDSHYLAGLLRHSGGYAVALFDLSTGEFAVERCDTAQATADLLRRSSPGEILVPDEQYSARKLEEVLRLTGGETVTAADSDLFATECARTVLLEHFGVPSLDGFGLEDLPEAIAVAGGVLAYVRDRLRHRVSHVRGLSVRQGGDFMVLDETTCLNLDLMSRERRARPDTLLGALDNTRTAMGARMLRRWMARPLRDPAAIDRRLDAVEILIERRDVLNALRNDLGEVRDMERLIARIDSGRGNARDLKALGVSLSAAPRLRKRAHSAGTSLMTSLGDALHDVPELTAEIERAIVDTPPPTVKDGGIFRSGYNAELDTLRELAGNARAWLARYQAEEQARSGIKNLKVRRNKVFGFYIEISKAQAGHVPENYERRQTLVNAERFVTPELKAYEDRILGSQERSMALEYQLFEDLRERISAETERIQTTADSIGTLDVLACFADRALALDYTRPRVDDSFQLEIEQGRHPVIEQLPDAERFVPNDTRMDCDQNRMLIITGPNMAGKSTYIRQVGLIAVMAQMGSFVPAAQAHIGVIDRVFTRVGAGDDLARGRSTFMVEMQETANILHNADRRSLIILDEIGRGTSTFDGISIAWSVAEYLHNEERLRSRTLFATHYHELTELALTLPGARNYNVLVKESGDKIVFLRRIVPGGSDQSYGIHVARLAGLPGPVISRAREVLANLEEGSLESGAPKLARRRRRRDKDVPGQLLLFDLQ